MKKTLRKSDIRGLNEKIKGYNIEISKKDNVEVFDKEIILVNGKQWFFYHEDRVIPTLKLVLEKQDILNKVTVDMGAVRFVTSGADIMRPGIVKIDEDIKKGDIVSIVDENNNKPLAVGEALFNAVEMKEMTSGKVIKNLHYVGDKLWKTQ